MPAKKKKIVTLEKLTQGKRLYKMQDVRQIVINRANELGLTAYKLAKLTGITEQTIREFLGERHHMRSDKLASVLAVLGLELKRDPLFSGYRSDTAARASKKSRHS